MAKFEIFLLLKSQTLNYNYFYAYFFMGWMTIQIFRVEMFPTAATERIYLSNPDIPNSSCTKRY